MSLDTLFVLDSSGQSIAEDGQRLRHIKEHLTTEHSGDQMRLDYLFTLTVADINGTNPTLWNAWRGSLLRQLYTETKRALRRGLENPVDKQVWIDETKNAAVDLLEDIDEAFDVGVSLALVRQGRGRLPGRQDEGSEQ